MGSHIARICLRPQLPGLERLFQVPCHIQVVVDRDKEFLGVARAISQLIGLPKALRSQNRLPHTSVCRS